MKLFAIFAFFLVASSNVIFSQWELILELPNNSTRKIATNNSTIFVVADTNIIFRSMDNGNTWDKLNTGFAIKSVFGLFIKGKTVLISANDGTKNGVYRSSDNGNTWKSINENQFKIPKYSHFASINNNIYMAAETAYGAQKSTDDGLTWSSANLTGQTISCLYAYDQTLFAGINTSSPGLWKSTDGGQEWYPSLTLKAGSGYPNSVIFHNSNIYVDGDAIYKSQLESNNYTKVNSSLISNFGAIVGFISAGNSILAASRSGGMYKALNSDDTKWVSENAGLPTGFSVTSTGSNSEYAFIGLFKKGLWRKSISSFNSVPNSSNRESHSLLSQNIPNPFSSYTNIFFKIEIPGETILKIYDLLGNEVSTILKDYLTNGEYTIQFDPLSLQNKYIVNTGTYYLVLLQNGNIETKKLYYIKE